MQDIQSLFQNQNYTGEILSRTNALMNAQPTPGPGYRISGIVQDRLLELITNAMLSRNNAGNFHLTSLAYSTFHQTLITSRMLFVSESDLTFLALFNRILKKNGVMKAILAENQHEPNYKRAIHIPNDTDFFSFSQNQESSSYSRNKFQYLVHSVHNIRDLSTIFNIRGIRLRGNFNKDYYGLPLIWFGLLNENERSKNSSRYGSISFKIKIDKILAKGRNYFAMGTRKYKKEHSHSILITNREHIRMQTQSNVAPNPLEFDFPRILNIEENQLCKKENNEWFVNDGLQLDENLRVNKVYQDWDHPEFCLEANEKNGDDHYAYFDFDDFKICFLEHGYCVKEFDKCRLYREIAMREFLELTEVRNFPSLSELRNCFDEETFQLLLQLQEENNVAEGLSKMNLDSRKS